MSGSWKITWMNAAENHGMFDVNPHGRNHCFVSMYCRPSSWSLISTNWQDFQNQRTIHVLHFPYDRYYPYNNIRISKIGQWSSSGMMKCVSLPLFVASWGSCLVFRELSGLASYSNYIEIPIPVTIWVLETRPCNRGSILWRFSWRDLQIGPSQPHASWRVDGFD